MNQWLMLVNLNSTSEYISNVITMQEHWTANKVRLTFKKVKLKVFYLKNRAVLYLSCAHIFCIISKNTCNESTYILHSESEREMKITDIMHLEKKNHRSQLKLLFHFKMFFKKKLLFIRKCILDYFMFSLVFGQSIALTLLSVWEW